MMLSVVTAVYNAESIVDTLVDELIKHITPVFDSFEIILVDDFSLDNSWEKIETLSERFPVVKGIKLSRNFGQHYALTAGLDHAKGDWVVVMDCDLQDHPSEIPKMYAIANQGYHMVVASRQNRKDSFDKRFFSYLFWKVLSYFTDSKINGTVANFGIYHRKVINAICSMREQNRFFPTMINWVGFKRGTMMVEHNKRHSGKSNYTMKKLLKLATDIILVNSDKVVMLFVKLGLVIFLLSIAVGVFYLVQKILDRTTVLGFTSIMISVWVLGGLIIFILGIIGLYIGKVFEGVKGRPVYIIEKTSNTA
ncbi:MAG: glycosyltransferase family 2 protein [Bacteroidetes bacterium]|nr:glycosyltransferase family 2 protein [Bacteroidota bacterium]